MTACTSEFLIQPQTSVTIPATLREVDLPFDHQALYDCGRVNDSSGPFPDDSSNVTSSLAFLRCQILSKLFFTFHREVNFYFPNETFVFTFFTSLFFSPEARCFSQTVRFTRFYESTWKSSQSPNIISKNNFSTRVMVSGHMSTGLRNW